ncbi:AMP-binding protein [Nocardioides perillae]|uniref:Acyl-coenzyme A synthetase/AMP-(Fatty) acid ligase n=1 Tax=Nocardioides perillae TaxID=1119534 RepID=A0A7Y9RVB3_9ACTN|nr:acyl-coenzyme A synthetase/AMP-(fatty) acid ligase [Nocardioides perillae]
MTLSPELHPGALPAAPPVTAPGGLVAHLRSFGELPALVGRGVPGAALSYAELADRVADAAAAFGTARRLVLLEGARDVDGLVAYLGAQAAHQVVLLAGGPALAPLRAAYDPDVVLDRAATADLHAALRDPAAARPTSAHDLHPALALLLSTSGSTGSPKLVRLSGSNLASNARAIAGYLDLRPGDVAPTVLPVEYCYGLSVVHSHLAVGAALLLTEDSVTDERLWDDLRRHGATSLAGVPHTFELLERSGAAERLLDPASGLRLRTLTQAGGRMDPEAVARWAERGARAGVDLVVMYGQTEATARMAWLPPHLAATASSAIGRPVAGSSFRLEPLPADEAAGLPAGTGELVFRGPGVMLGYATTPADLARGRELHELRTGDLGRQRSDGLWEVVGRRARFAKVLGLRVDLDRCERLLAAEGVVALAADGGDRVVLGVCDGARPVDTAAVRGRAARLLGLPPGRVAVVTYAEPPRLASGKPDRRAVAALAATDGSPGERRADRLPAATASPYAAAAAATAEGVAALYARALGRDDVSPRDTFVGLGGDSLTYVEVSVGLEALLGRVPGAWPTTPVADLADLADLAQRTGRTRTAAGRASRRTAPGRPAGAAGPAPTTALGRALRLRHLETGVVLRALAILTIVATHANLVTLLGGAHLLLAVVGANLARFALAPGPARERTRRVLLGAARIAVPSVVVLGTVSLWTDGLGWRQVLLLNSLTAHGWSEPAWHYWFVEVVVVLLLATAALLALPPVQRLERRFPFGLPVALALLGLLTRYDVVATDGDELHRAQVVAWLFCLGWAAARARTHAHRVLLTALVVATVPGFTGDPARDAYVALGVLALVWLPTVRVPDVVARLAVPLAGASLWTYLVHWQVYPHLEHDWPLAATVLSFVAGHLAWRAWTGLVRRLPALPPGGRARG